jgi:hypothetical protein
MRSAVAEIVTDKPSRYLVQLCKHAAAIARGHGPGTRLAHAPAGREAQIAAEWSDTRGVLTFTPWGTCTLTANAATLSVRIDASDEQSLHKIQDILTSDLERIGRRAGLSVRWSDAP